MDDYDRYKQDLSIPTTNLAWFLHGAGMEHFHLIEKDMPMPARNEMLMRVDAISICYSDVKLILAGNNHPRVLVPLDKRPTVPGHEVSLTVIKPGESVLPQFKPGERYIIQADIFKNGQIDTFGYTQSYFNLYKET